MIKGEMRYDLAENKNRMLENRTEEISQSEADNKDNAQSIPTGGAWTPPPNFKTESLDNTVKEIKKDIRHYRKNPQYFCQLCLYYESCSIKYHYDLCPYWHKWNRFADEFERRHKDVDRPQKKSRRTQRKSGERKGLREKGANEVNSKTA